MFLQVPALRRVLVTLQLGAQTRRRPQVALLITHPVQKMHLLRSRWPKTLSFPNSVDVVLSLGLCCSLPTIFCFARANHGFRLGEPSELKRVGWSEVVPRCTPTHHAPHTHTHTNHTCTHSSSKSPCVKYDSMKQPKS